MAIKNMGSADKVSRRGYHISGIREEWKEEFIKLYTKIYQVKAVINNEVGATLARAFATFKHGVKVYWSDFLENRSKRAAHHAVSSSIEDGKVDLKPKRLSSYASLQLPAEEVAIIQNWRTQHEESLSIISHMLAQKLAEEKEAELALHEHMGSKTHIEKKLLQIESSLRENQPGEEGSRDLNRVQYQKQEYAEDLKAIFDEIAEAEQVHKTCKEKRLTLEYEKELYMSCHSKLSTFAMEIARTGVQSLQPAPIEHPAKVQNITVEVSRAALVMNPCVRRMKSQVVGFLQWVSKAIYKHQL